MGPFWCWGTSRITSYNVCYTKLLRKEHALCKGDFKSTVNEQPGSASVVQSVSASLNGIGYSGIGYKTSGVRALPLSKSGTDYVDATEENALKGAYPLSRYLYIYVNKHPNKPLDPMVLEFVKLRITSYNVCYTKLLRSQNFTVAQLTALACTDR